MKNLSWWTLLSLVLLISCDAPKEDPIKIVFVTGDEEYRSEESMPMLGRILERELHAEIIICYARDSLGFIDPNRSDHIDGLEALTDADLMVMFTRFRALPDAQLKMITDYAESGRPMVGFRTSTHAFLYKEDTIKLEYNNDWPAKIFGQQWITHHGHFDDGNKPLTAVSLVNESHPILNGVEPFEAYSWLYHVNGGDWSLNGDCDILLKGKSLRSKHEEEGRLDKFPIENPVGWTKTYTGNQGRKARVFFTTLGHPYDFNIEAMRIFSLNGIYWALGYEDQIPDGGVEAKIVGDYQPNNSGFGEKFKKKRKSN